MYAFVNNFSSSDLRQRITMMQRQRSGWSYWLRYVALCEGVLAVALACQLAQDKAVSRYTHRKNGTLYGLITARSQDSDLDTLQHVLAQRDVTFVVNTLTRLPDGRISRIALTMQPPKPAHPISTTVGALGLGPIPSVYLTYNGTEGQIGAGDDTFPKRLVALAEREGPVALGNDTYSANESAQTTGANAKYGLFRVFLRNDFLESNYFNVPATGVRMTADYHLALRPEYQKAVVFIDGKEATPADLSVYNAIDLKKIVVFERQAAVQRLGDERAKHGLVLIYSLPNMNIRDKYAATPLLEQVYPELFTRRIGHVWVH